MPKPTVVILGASADRAKFGNKSLRAHLEEGYEVFPVNPKGGTIEGLTVYKRLAEVPIDRFDRISSYLPPAVGIALLDEIAAAAPSEFFLNPGSESPELLDKARAIGLTPILACSIVDLGRRPEEFGA